MNSIWFKELGFFNNPFSIKPAIFSDKLVGYEAVVDELSYGILNKKILFLEGEYGEGKSSILKRLLNDFGGKKQVIYYSCNRIEARLNVKKLLNGRYGFWGKLFDLKPKDMILFLDEAQELSKKDYEKLHSYFQEGYFKAIVCVGKEFKEEEISEKLKDNMQQIKLSELSDDDAIKLVRRRVGSLPLLSDGIIKSLFSVSNKNVRLLLKNCEAVCKHAVNYGETKITEEMINKVLGVKVKIEKKPVEKKKKVEKKPEPKKEEKKVEKKKVKKKLKESPPKSKEEQVYKPDAPLNIGGSTEEMLNKGTEELLDDDQYY